MIQMSSTCPLHYLHLIAASTHRRPRSRLASTSPLRQLPRRLSYCTTQRTIPPRRSLPEQSLPFTWYGDLLVTKMRSLLCHCPLHHAARPPRGDPLGSPTQTTRPRVRLTMRTLLTAGLSIPMMTTPLAATTHRVSPLRCPRRTKIE